MKHFVDYKPTEEEIKKVFGDKKEYEEDLRYFDKYPGGDGEKMYIAHLLHIRKQYDESRAMIESMEDEEYKRDCLEHTYSEWGKWEVPRCFKWVRRNSASRPGGRSWR